MDLFAQGGVSSGSLAMSSHSAPQVLASFGLGEPTSKVVQVRFDRHEVHQVKVVQNEVGDSVYIELESPPYAFHAQKTSPDSTASTANGAPYVKPIFETCCNVDCPFESLYASFNAVLTAKQA